MKGRYVWYKYNEVPMYCIYDWNKNVRDGIEQLQQKIVLFT